MDMILGFCKFPKMFSSLFSVTYVVGTHSNCLYEAIPMCTYNICIFNKLVFQHRLFETNSQPLSFYLFKEMSM